MRDLVSSQGLSSGLDCVLGTAADVGTVITDHGEVDRSSRALLSVTILIIDLGRTSGRYERRDLTRLSKIERVSACR